MDDASFVNWLNAQESNAVPAGNENLGILTPVKSLGNGLLACEWFNIRCLDGDADRCCGSYNSCVSYCEEFCANEPGEIVSCS